MRGAESAPSGAAHELSGSRGGAEAAAFGEATAFMPLSGGAGTRPATARAAADMVYDGGADDDDAGGAAASGGGAPPPRGAAVAPRPAPPAAPAARAAGRRARPSRRARRAS